jgi:hypothetical protein
VTFGNGISKKIKHAGRLSFSRSTFKMAAGALLEQAQKRPKVFGCAQIISLLNTEQNHLTRLPTALPMRNVDRPNVADPLCVALAASFNHAPCHSL